MRHFLLFVLLIPFLGNAQNLTADFLATPLELCPGESVSFTNLSTAGQSPIVSWNWDFGDGGSSPDQNPTHTYVNAGTYNVTLTIQAQDGSSDPEVKVGYILVHPQPNVGFDLTSLPCTIPLNADFANNSDAGMTYAWGFGNGQTSTQFTPQGIVYSNSGTFNVSLIVTNPITGCSDTIESPIDIYNFETQFSIPDTVCLGTLIAFNDNTIGNPDTWQWDFGDGSMSNLSSDSYAYSSSGTYSVTLTSENSGNGCSGIMTQTTVVLDAPVVGFTPSEILGCTPLDVTFTNTTTGGTDFQWDFGNGATYNGQNPPTQVYLDSGMYDVSLVVTNDFGCTATLAYADLITASPMIAGFTINPFQGCAPLDVVFTDTTQVINPNDPIISWEWDLGNGTTSSSQNPPMQTYGVGLYDISMIVTTASGCVDTLTDLAGVQVGSIDTVLFTNSNTITCDNDTIWFTNQSIIGVPFDSSEVSYYWYMNGQIISYQENGLATSYPDTGFFNVTLVVEFRGCQETATITDAIYVNGPVASFFSSPSVICNPGMFPVDAAIVDLSSLGEVSDSVEMYYDFGDGTTLFLDDSQLDDANQGDTTHAFLDYGVFQMSQVIYNYTTGCSDSVSSIFIVTYTDAEIYNPMDTMCLGDTVFLADSSTTSDDFLLSMGDFPFNYLDMGNGYIYPGYVSPIDTFVYSSAGTYEVVLTRTNNFGCPDSDTTYITVLDPPEAFISADNTDGCAPLQVTYTNNSVAGQSGLDPNWFEWTYDNGTTQITTDTSTNIVQTYSGNGTFAMYLSAMSPYGCVSEVDSVIITITQPLADFSLDSVICNYETLEALNGSQGLQPLTYEWFMDGSPAGTQTDLSQTVNEITDPSYNSVVHDVSLVVSDSNGCTDTLSSTVVVSLPYANANYSFSGATANEFGEFDCPPVFVSLEDTSSSYGAINSWDWTFGNGNASILQNPQNTYVYAGTYTATLTITDEFGCSDDTTLTDYLVVNGPSGTPIWTGSGDVCDPTIELEILDPIGITNADWDMGNGDSIQSIIPFEYTYTASGNYIPLVTLSDNNGCFVPYTLPVVDVHINDLNAYFEASMLEGEVTEPFTFYDYSTYNPDPIQYWEWDFGDAVITNPYGDNVTYGFDVMGYQDVTLTVYDTLGCSDSYTIQVLLTANFFIPNVFTPNGDNVNEYFQLDFDVFDTYDFFILNRWGNVVARGLDHQGVIMWDGKNEQGKECNDGVYFYKLVGKYHNGTTTEKHGHVTLSR
jgi:gliding motility-associated-like protein